MIRLTADKLISEPISDVVSFEKYSEDLNFSIKKYSSSEMVFDIVGIYPGLVNAFRRILLSEVPSMAIEKVHLFNNTSIIQDEVLAQSLGLVPLKADARLFQYRLRDDGKYNDRECLKFELKVKCKNNPNCRAGHYRAEDRYVDHTIYSSHLKWIPLGDQESMHTSDSVGPVFDNIIIAKMRPGHEIYADLYAVKGIGRDHAKFCPVGTASFRLLPQIKLLGEIVNDDAEKLQACFSPGVIGIREHKGKKIAFVQNARIDSCSRNVLRHADLKDRVELCKVPGHYIFTIEPVVAISPDELFVEAIKVLKKKCVDALHLLQDQLIETRSV